MDSSTCATDDNLPICLILDFKYLLVTSVVSVLMEVQTNKGQKDLVLC